MHGVDACRLDGGGLFGICFGVERIQADEGTLELLEFVGERACSYLYY